MASNSSLLFPNMSPAHDLEGMAPSSTESSLDIMDHSSVTSKESSGRKPAFELVGSSLRLRNFVPVKVLRKYDGGYRPFEVCFPAEVLLDPISGTYGNYIGASGGERYVPPAIKCYSFLPLAKI
jgi:hypothetical protein